MAIVYGGAVCTIAAIDAKSSGDSLLSSPSPKSSDSGDLNSRAWVLQERALSARTLAYTEASVHWECRMCEADQTQPNLVIQNDSQNSIILHSRPKQLFTYLRDFRIGEEDESLHEFMDIEDGSPLENPEAYEPFLKFWWQFLEVYTPCSLSHESVKFLAMNGIVAITQRHTRLRNTWGLWGKFLEYELLWSIDPTGPASHRPVRWRTPYWSWASTENGRVINDYYKRLPARPNLMIEPEITVPVTTSFDQELPIPSWTAENYAIKMHGDLRSAKLMVDFEAG